MNELARKLSLPGAALIAAGLLSGCTTVPPSEDPVLIKLNQLETRLVRIERVMDNDSLVALVVQMEQLEEETRQLRGEIETIRYEVEGSSTRQRDLYLDVDRRLQTLETRGGSARSPTTAAAGGAAAGAGAAAAAGSAPASGSDRAAYQAAFDILKDGRYEEAAAQFQRFLATYPDSALADNAQYWLAETYYVTRDFARALPAFQAVLDQFPESRKIPDALLKVGFCHYELGNWTEARAALTQVTESYPETTAARLAGQRLARMDTEGK